MFNEFRPLDELMTILLPSLNESLYMVGASVLLTYLIGLPLGIILVVTDRGHILENLTINRILGIIVNILRSTPFIILMVTIIPFTRLLVGKSIGTTAAIVPLVVAAAPFAARLVESSLKEIDKGIIEAAVAMGASPWQIIRKVLVPEAKPGLILGATITTISLIGYSAMAGVIGGGGVGTLAINYGYYRGESDVMIVTVAALVLIVQGIQSLGDWGAKKVNKK